MNNARASGRPIGQCAGSGHAVAAGAADWLGLAAAPTFALMALWTALSGGPPDVLCTSRHDAFALNAMALMYALMSAFHATPWLQRIVRRRASPHRAQAELEQPAR
ncbi:MAG TPA: hypothetical protein VFR73_24355 [Hyphomicrobiaceae bacterium]|nr:hypothetical protein [Hyphomicrobiaceae bacterium]